MVHGFVSTFCFLLVSSGYPQIHLLPQSRSRNCLGIIGWGQWGRQVPLCRLGLCKGWGNFLGWSPGSQLSLRSQ